jgi:dihydrofolate reductase
MLALIVAYAKNRVIGNKGYIPWKIEGEQKRFKRLTTGNVVVMGRISYEEIAHPLPDRMTIVVSNTKNYDEENCITVSSLEEAIKISGDRDIYISGGSRLYQEAIPIVDKMYITEIDAEIEGDTYFPEFQEEAFDREVEKRVDGEIPYTYITYTRKHAKVPQQQA